MQATGRALLAILGFYTVTLAVMVMLAVVVPPNLGSGATGILASQAVQFAGGAALAGLLWAARGWRSWTDQGWPGLRPGMEAFARGLGLGVVMAALVVIVEVALGVARFSLTGESGSAYAAAALPLSVVLAIAALGEELLFRGLPLSRLVEAVGPFAAAGILAAGFIAIHLPNPGVTVLGLVNIGLASLLLSAAFLTAGGLPAAWGLHFGWNAGLALGADAPVSGVGFRLPALEFETPGPEWLSGGAFGPEGGLVASLVIISATLWLGRRVPLAPQRRGDRGEGGVRAA